MFNKAEALIREGLQYHKVGNRDAAERCYHAALEVDQACADAWHLLSVLARDIAMFDVALELVGQAIAIQPEIALFRVTQGNLLRELKDNKAAEAAYQAALALMPNSFEAMTGLGLLYRSNNDAEHALPCMLGALSLRPQSPEAQSNLGVVLEMQGDLPAAIECYRKAVLLEPNSPTYLSNLGLSLVLQGEFAEGERCLKQCIELAPDSLDAHLVYSRALRREEKFAEALVVLDAAQASFPGSGELLLERGLLKIRMDQLDDAEQALLAAGRIHPRPEVSVALGSVAQLRGDVERAIYFYQQAVSMQEDCLPAWKASAGLFLLLQKMPNAEQCLRRVLAIDPDDLGSRKMLGTALLGLGLFAQAFAEFETVLKVAPDIPGLVYEYGLALHRLGRSEEGIAWLEAAQDKGPVQNEMLGIQTNLAMIYKDLGKMGEALDCLRKTISFSKYHSNLIFSMIYASQVSPEEIVAEARNFDRLHCQPSQPTGEVDFKNSPDPARKLRVGFVSADLRAHAVAYFIEPVWQEMDKAGFEIYAYHSHFATDHFSARLKQLVSRWRGVGTLSDDDLYAQIRKDQIDILVDLSGHTAGNRLKVFARRAAPVQFGWLGHPSTTGVGEMDYLLTNAYAEPVGMTEHLNTETLWRLPESYCVYRPGDNSPDVVAQAPCIERGYVTFGCFNNLAKVTEEVIRVWCRIMQAAPDSRLMIEWTTFSDPALTAEFAARFARYGIPRERLELVPRTKENQYKLYNQIDCALDPFPCNSGTTGYDTVWMGVPYVTLAGRHLMSRMGVMILSNVGLQSLIAQSEDEYVALAVRMAQDRPYLLGLREGLRAKMQASPLMDAPRFARYFEAALRGMWQAWCTRHSEAKKA